MNPSNEIETPERGSASFSETSYQASGNHAPLNRSSSARDWSMVTPGDVIRSVLSKTPSVLFIALLTSVAVVGIAVALPNRYASDGMLYVRLGRAALSADPTALQSASGGVSIQENRSAEVISVSEMLSSHEIAARVVDQLGADRINAPRTWIDRAMLKLQDLPLGGGGGDVPEGLSVKEYELQIEREEAIQKIHKWMHVTTPKNGYTVAISTQGPDPLLMQAITQTVMNRYTSYHVEAHQTDGSVEFFERQVAESQQAAIEARDELQRARSESGWMSLGSAESTLRDRIIQLESALDEAESELAGTKQRSIALQEKLASTEQWIPMEITKGIANAAGDSMRSTLFGEQVHESEQLATLKPNHPKYRLLEEKMTRSSEIVTDESADRQQTREAINPTWQQLESEFSLASASAEGLRSKCESLSASLAEANKSLQQMNRDAVKLARLKWQADIAEETLIGHAKSLQDARVRSELDRLKMSDVSVIQDASLKLKKVGPPRALIAIAGGLLGLGLGVFQAILRCPVAEPRNTSMGSFTTSTRVDAGQPDNAAARPHRDRIPVPSGTATETLATETNSSNDLAAHSRTLPR
ncbi:MAG: exopolysaccharide biosynthesis protein [Planctomycetota bacterium]